MIYITVHRLTPNGTTATSLHYEVDAASQKFVVKMRFNAMVDSPNASPKDNSDKLSLKRRTVESNVGNPPTIRVSKSGTSGSEEFNPRPKYQRDSKIPNVPATIVCQNCDTNFPTKYQYQRHQCEFNAEKVILKPNVDIKDLDKGTRVKFDCPTCGKQFVSINNLERHETSHDETNLNVCEHCNKQFVSENRLRIHKENHCKKAGDISKFYRSDVTVWKCQNCFQVFARPTSALKHTERCVEELSDNPKPKSSSSEYPKIQKFLTELLLQCEYCNRTYADKSYLLAHQKRHTTEFNYKCITCEETFDSYVMASKHWLTKCSDESNLFYLPKLTYCEYCDRTFKSHEFLYTHKHKKKHYTPKIYSAATDKTDSSEEPKELRIVENKEAIVKLIEDVLYSMNESYENKENEDNATEGTNCELVIKSEVCSESNSFILSDNVSDYNKSEKRRGRKRKSSRQTNKSKRLNVAVEEGFKYQCERCVSVWDTVVELENHRETEHPAKFKCEECGQVVHSTKALLIHSRAHQSLKPYVCEICKRCYSQTSHLWQHMRFHQGIKPFACPHEGCEARYTIRPDLKDHIRKVHTRERPFKCSVCDKCFLTGSVYYQHRLIHTNDRRYGCDICQKRFFRADALNNHRRIHTDERPYPCEICGRQFRQKGDRNKHVRTQHPS